MEPYPQGPPEFSETTTHLTRPRLVALVRAALRKGHVLIGAPGGYGKTTLLLDLARSLPEAHYLALSLADTDLAYFQARLRLLYASQQTLLIDDVHVLTDAPEVWLWLAEQLRSSEPRLVLSGRFVPDLPADVLALTWLGADALAFTAEETHALLELRGGSASDALDEWYRRAAGWALALDLMTRSSRRAVMPANPQARRTLIADATRELLVALPSDVRQFMRLTVVPLRFNVELAAVLLDLRQVQVAPLLREVVTRNLFVQAVEPSGWFRYHDLIREVLHDPQTFELISRRIVAWFAARADWEMAIEHALAAGLNDEAANVLNHMPQSFISESNRYRTFRRWVLSLDEQTRAANPELLVRLGRDLHYLGQVAEGWTYLNQAQSLIQAKLASGAPRELLVETQLVIATALRRDGKPEQALEIYHAVLNEPQIAPEVRVRVLLGLGGTLDAISQLRAARDACRAGLALAIPAGDELQAFNLRINLATVLTSLGAFEQAAATLTANEAFCAERVGPHLTNLAYQTELDYERGDWNALAANLQYADGLVHQTEDAGHTAIWIDLVRALCQTGVGDFQAAQKTLDAALPYSYEQELYRALYQCWLFRRSARTAQAITLAARYLEQPIKNLRVRAQFALEAALALVMDGQPAPMQYTSDLARVATLQLRADMVRLRALLAIVCHRAGDSRWQRHARAALHDSNRAGYEFLLTLRDPELGMQFWTLCIRAGLAEPSAWDALRILARAQVWGEQEITTTLEPLLALLRAQEPPIRARAARALEQIERSQVLSTLNEALDKETDPHALTALERARAHLEQLPPPLLKVQLMGEFRVRRDGTLISEQAWHRPIVQRLFQYFTLHRGERLARDQIIQDLWTDSDPQNAAVTFRTVLSRLRNTLEPYLRPKAPSRYLGVEGDVYRFDPHNRVSVDTERFTTVIRRTLKDAGTHDIPQLAPELVQVLESYQPLLPYLPLQEWLLEPRERLNALYVEGTLYVAQALLIYNRFNEALDWSNRTIVAAPWSEEAYQTLMRAHARLGNRSLALKAYADATTALKRELDLEPSPLTEWLAQRLRAGQEI